jgi:hypothetical protein
VQTRVDDLETGVPEAASDHLDPSVVTVETRLRDDDPTLSGHASQFTDAPPDPACQLLLRKRTVKACPIAGTSSGSSTEVFPRFCVRT